MREGWHEVELGQLFTPINERLAEYEDEPEVFSVTKYDGIVLARDYFDKRIASAKLDTYKVVLSDDWAYSTIHIDEGSIARNRLGVNGVVSPMYTTMRFDSEEALPEYCELVLRSPKMLAAYGDAQRGSINRRKSLSWKVFERLTIPLPPLSEQRRIVDLIDAVDGAIAAAEDAQARTAESLAQLRRLMVGEITSPLGTLVAMRSGPSWKAADQSDVERQGYDPVLTITNTPGSGRLDLANRRYVQGIPASSQRLDPASLIMIRTNGNRSRIGNVYRATPEVEGFAVSAFQIAIRPHASQDSAFLYWYLGSPEVQAAITDNASGSTGLGNIAVGWLKKLEIPTLSEHERFEYIETCEAADAALQGLEDVTANLRNLRSNLLTALLSGDHEIPDSYDELMAKAF